MLPQPNILRASTSGEIPLQLLFSGTVFYAPADSPLQVAPISWEQEARFKLPVKLWREMMDAYYPNTVWINLRRDVFERLYQYKMQHGIPTWEQALEQVLVERRGGELVNLDQVEKIAEAVLYEGYMLYPYRPSSVKNQQRWNFGVLYPPSYCDGQTGSEASAMQTECLLKATPSHAADGEGALSADRAAHRSAGSRHQESEEPDGVEPRLGIRRSP